MIEENIIEWLELGDSIQKIDIFNGKKSIFFYKINFLINQSSIFSQYIYFLIIFFYFAQIWELNIFKVDVEGDGLLEIIKYLEKIFLLRELITDFKTYLILLIISILCVIITILLSIINIILYNKKKKIQFLIFINSLMNTLNVYYLNGPCLEIVFSSILCYENSQVVLCSFKNISKLIILILCIIYGIFLIFCIDTASVYINSIGSINDLNITSKINNNFTTIIVIIKIFFFLFHFIIQFFLKDIHYWIIYVYQILFILAGICISIYSYKELFYYNLFINNSFHFGWYFTTWFSICIFIKYLLKIKDITLFVIFGLIIITLGFYSNDKFRAFQLITEFNIFEANNLKSIEVYNAILLNLLYKNDQKSKVLIEGVIKRFEEYLSSNPELYEQYHKLLNDKHLKRKFALDNELTILSIISIIYSYNIEKSRDSTDITLNMCYFLINKFKNPVYAIWLCTKIKTCNIIQSYYKYVLMMHIKNYLIELLNKKMNKISIKHVQISSVILYSQYVELFKVKIYDATCSQIEYFDILKNNLTNEKTTENFLKTGEDILSLREDILKIWEKIILLNPFSNESEKDYMLYLETILQDDILIKTEEKRYNTLKAEKLPERNSTYYSLYKQELSTVLLADGYTYNGKIVYATPNFPLLFMFTGKEILNNFIDDLLPDVIQRFHKYLIEDAIKYSNLGYIFKKHRNVLLKGKNGLIFNVYLYVKPVPNLTFGLLYFINLQKIQEHNFILILDENLFINGFTGINQTSSNFIINNNNYGLSYNINGHHIGTIIPEILLHINYDNKLNSFYITKKNIDLKGNLYPIHNLKEFDEKIFKILQLIKNRNIAELDKDKKLSSFDEYEDLIKDINNLHIRSYSIFYRIEAHNFVGGKYKYYRVYIINDLLYGNDNSLSINSNNANLTMEENNNLREYQNNGKIKDLYKGNNYTIRGNESFEHNSGNKLIRLKTEKKKTHILNKDEIDNINQEINKTTRKEINLIEGNNNQKNQNVIESSNNNKKRKEIYFSKISNPSSIITHSSTESAEFNKLKNEIINKNDSFYVKLMKFLSYIFIIINIALIIYDFFCSKKVINIMVEYLRQNLYFIHTKICTAVIYNSALSLRFIKYKIIEGASCGIQNCQNVFPNQIKNCIKEIRIQKYNATYFYQDFQNILGRTTQLDLFVYQSDYKDYLNLDSDTFLNLIISQAMKVLTNLSNYMDENGDVENREIIDVYLRNLLENTKKYFYSNYTELTGNEKDYLCHKISFNSPYRLIASVILAIIIMFIFFYYIYLTKNIEIFFLDKLINFTSASFDEYLKNLEELKKKFKDDVNDEEDKNMEELDLKEEDIEEKNDDVSKKTNKKEVIYNNVNSPKKKKNKQNEIQKQKLKKKKIMSKYFYKLNLIFAIKMGLILIMSTIYFILSLVITNNMKKNYLELDSVVEQINLVYFNSFKIFINFKEQIEKYFNTNNKSVINIPKDSEIERPKFGNVFLYITGSDKFSEEGLTLLHNLYNDDTCKIIENNETYSECQNIFSSILKKGMEQAVIQISIIITSCVDELNSLKKNIDLKELYNYDNGYTYPKYEKFMAEYMLKSFLKTQDIFEIFRNDEKAYIFNIEKKIFIVFFIICLFLLIFLIYFIYAYKRVINSFFNFIGIMPSKFITDDENLYKTILKLEQNFY